MEGFGKGEKNLLLGKALLVLGPGAILAGALCLETRRFYLTSLMVILYGMLLFAMRLERRKPRAREIAVLAVMVALGVAGRLAFFMLPQFKPCAAVIIITAVCLGGQAGFLTGAMTAFVSNLFMGQGPWTPWQMLCFGLIGLLAGALASRGLLSTKRIPLCVFGGLSVMVIYGGIMDPASLLLLGQAEITAGAVLTAWAAGLVPNLIHSAATVFFLAALSQPLIDKLSRVKKKYGLLEREQPF